MNRLLRRQLSRAGIDAKSLTGEMQTFLALVDEVYESFDADRITLERSLELRSSELQAANRDIRASAEVMKRTLQATADGILAVDGQGNVLHVNDRYFEILGLPRSIFDLKESSARLAMIAERLTDPEEFLERMRQVMAGKRTPTRDTLNLKSGKVVERSSRPLSLAEGGTGRVWSYRDITERQLLEEQLRHQAFHDSLTGLANRARFMDRVEQAMERSLRTGSPVHVLFMDVDNFKSVNDTLGHSKGDEAICELASRIAATLRPGDTAARLGGDEFGLLIEDIESTQEVAAIAQHLLDVIRAAITIDAREVMVDASIGVATSHPVQPPKISCATRTSRCTWRRTRAAGAISSTNGACTRA